MNIVFFNSNSNHFYREDINNTNFPSYTKEIIDLAKKYSKDNFYIVCQKPGFFLWDLNNKNLILPENLNFYIFDEKSNSNNDIDFLSDFIINLNPHIAIAFSYWVKPYDWLCAKDALIAQKLKEKNIKTICNSLEIALNCFDKNKTKNLLENNSIKIPKSVYVHHALFWNAGNKKEVKDNIYKESVLWEIEKLKYPVVIKDTVGLSSYGMEVVNKFNEAKFFLESKRNNSDRLVEEYLEGLQFGLEIYGRKNKYTIMDPFLFSTNKYGITSPKQCIKLGPINHKKFKIKSLKKNILKLAKKIQLDGIAQIDLVFNKGQWYILEINPRLSGMTQCYAASINQSIYETMYKIAQNKKLKYKKENLIMNFKLSLTDEKKLKEISKIDFIKYINQTENLAAKQEREKGYCEIIFGKGKKISNLEKNLDFLKEKYKELFDDELYQKAKSLLEILK